MSRAKAFYNESQSCSPWTAASHPRRILIIRLQALGDVAVTLPACAGLRVLFPNAAIDYLTSVGNTSLVASVRVFDRVHGIPECTPSRARLASALRWGLLLRRQHYDVIVDLQRNWMTRLIRRLALPRAWGEFDRFAPRLAGERVLQTFHRTGFVDLTPSFSMPLQSALRTDAQDLLRRYGCDPGSKIVVLNPAGLWKSRNWPIEHYIDLAKLWLDHEPVKVLLLGTERIGEKAAYIAERVGDQVINLVGQTSPELAFAILQHVQAVVTEDSGLMHMAWCSGIPVVALFGSTMHVWSAPSGPHSRCFHSGDLPCGQCMEPECRYGDVHCLTRYLPHVVFQAAQELIPATLPCPEAS